MNDTMRLLGIFRRPRLSTESERAKARTTVQEREACAQRLAAVHERADIARTRVDDRQAAADAHERYDELRSHPRRRWND